MTSHFGSVEEAKAFLRELERKKKEIVVPITKVPELSKNEIKKKIELDHEAVKNTFTEIKNDFLDKEITRKKSIKRLKMFIHETYKDLDKKL